MARESKRTRDEKRFGKPDRFADWLMENPVTELTSQRKGFAQDLCAETIRNRPLVDICNVVEFLDSCHGNQQPHVSNGYPSCVPFLDHCFVEYRTGAASVGHIVYRDPSDPDEWGFMTFWRLDHHAIAVTVGHGKVWLDANHDMQDVACEVNPGHPEFTKRDLGHLGIPLLLAISFANCKNTTIDPHEPNAKLNRERAKYGLKPFLRYHTINIDPMRKVLKSEGGIETNGLKKALHICRGHFARYSEDKPLFGHTSGLVWRPAHTRGSLGQGVVVSDYKVNAPKGECKP